MEIANPRYFLWSLSSFGRGRCSQTLVELVEWRPAYGVLKLFLELTLPLGGLPEGASKMFHITRDTTRKKSVQNSV
jgi:hypothetical protein